MAEHLPYGKLLGLLTCLGYTYKVVQWQGTNQWVFQHKELDNATIFIPQKSLDQVIHPMHLGTVRATLKAHGLMSENAECLL